MASRNRICEQCAREFRGTTTICVPCALGVTKTVKPDVAAVKAAKELRENIPALLQLCHPDKHDNSEASQRITQWLLDMKKMAKRP